MQKIRDKRLCYYCNEKYEPSHKLKATCKAENNIREDNLVVSIKTIFGSTSYQTMRIHGNIKKRLIRITSDVICQQLTWSQGKEFQADLRLISLGGCDMVLGIQWLVELRPILYYFKNLRMEFIANRRKFMLSGATTSPKKLVSTYWIQGVYLQHL
ncbi:hypothetical protein AAG906_016677 [Vitis piasezkii]